jgi:hypothetical protein
MSSAAPFPLQVISGTQSFVLKEQMPPPEYAMSPPLTAAALPGAALLRERDALSDAAGLLVAVSRRASLRARDGGMRQVQLLVLASPADKDQDETHRDADSFDEAHLGSGRRARPLLFVSLDLDALPAPRHESGSRGPVCVLVRNLGEPRQLPDPIAGCTAQGSVLFEATGESEVVFSPAPGAVSLDCRLALDAHEEWRCAHGDAVRAACLEARQVQDRLVDALEKAQA